MRMTHSRCTGSWGSPRAMSLLLMDTSKAECVVGDARGSIGTVANYEADARNSAECPDEGGCVFGLSSAGSSLPAGDAIEQWIGAAG
jgi:hypothetical protein